MKISIVTVCYNSGSVIEETIKSVLAQTYKDTEYIIIDGKSSDDTMQIVEKYSATEPIRVVSEPDRGLYDAMNKAADIATGDYIIYMNSGDVFATDDALEKVMQLMDDKYDMVYGNVYRDKPTGCIYETYRGGRLDIMIMLLKGRMMCHQSMLISTQLMRDYRYDLNYSITADYDFVVRLIKNKKNIKYVDVAISRVENIEGISSLDSNLEKMRAQDDQSIKKNFPLIYTLIVIPKWCYRKLISK